MKKRKAATRDTGSYWRAQAESWKKRALLSEGALLRCSERIATGKWRPENVLASLEAASKRIDALAAANERKRLLRKAISPGYLALGRKALAEGVAPHNVVERVVRQMRKLNPEYARSKEVVSRMLKPLLSKPRDDRHRRNREAAPRK